MTTTVLRNVWLQMHMRCEDTDHNSYGTYGAKGIGVCVDWNEYSKFYDWAMSNGYRKGLFLDRIDNSVGYSPDNCRFLTRRENNNNKTNNRNIEAFGEIKTAAEWGRDARAVVRSATIIRRLDLGWLPEEAIGTTVKETGKPNRKRGGTDPKTIFMCAFNAKMSIRDWADSEYCTVGYETLRSRYHAGWEDEVAITTPSQSGRKKVQPAPKPLYDTINLRIGRT